MVNFSVFNELSLPLRKEKEFEDFFEILTKLKSIGLNKIRMDREFTQYPEILPNITFQELIGISNRDKKRRLLSFIKNGITVIESPLIINDEDEKEQLLENEYFYDKISTNGGLACCDIWNTIAISFNSKDEWNHEKVILRKETISDEQEIDIRHASTIKHLEIHQDFFDKLEAEKKLDITQENLWEKRAEFFPKRIIFCKEVEKQIKNIDKVLFQQAIGILRDIECGRKLITEYKYSGEKETVKTNSKMTAQREFTINEKKIFFENHIKSLINGSRIYFLEQDDKIYIGYIGSHLTTKKNK